MRHVSEEICRENKKTRFMFTNFSPKIVSFMTERWKNAVGPEIPQMATQHGACAMHAGQLSLHTHTHTLRICNTYCFSTEKRFTRTRLDVTFYVHCLSCNEVFLPQLLYCWFYSIVRFYSVVYRDQL
jgi:hypothetical protein